MQYSHSRVECFDSCKFKYKLRYIDKIKVIPAHNADNALYLGSAMGIGLEKGVEAAIKAYYDSFPIVDDLQINEVIKLEYLIQKVSEMIPEGVFEYKLVDSDFIGFIDLLVENEDGTFDICDFKYSNNIKNYMDSDQLHLYKYYFEKQTGKKVRDLYFLFIPKVSIKQKKTEDLVGFRKRIKSELEESEIKLVPVKYDPNKVIEFFKGIKKILETTEYEKEPNYLCNWCEYQEYCERGIDYMILPKNERRNIAKIEKKVAWLYGAPFCGKTTLANKFPDPLMLNTDGNIKFVDAPYLSIKDQVTVEGRQTKRKLAWEVFKETLDELEKKQNDFKTIVVDLLEDIFEHCRVYIYDRDGITHESDNSFKYYDIVRTEFLSTLKRLMNLDYENIILISHEDTSKDITKKSGDKITAIKPNLTEKVANKVAGMVDIVARVVADGDERTLSFKTNEVIFGGGRLTVTEKVIPLDYDQFMQVYVEANSKAAKNDSGSTEKSSSRSRKNNDNPVNEPAKDPGAEGKTEHKLDDKGQQKGENVGEVQPGRRTRKQRDTEPGSTENPPAPGAEQNQQGSESADQGKGSRKRRGEE